MKPFVLSAPLIVNWTLSFRCNFACNHCYSRAEDASAELSTAQIKSIMDTLAARKVSFINFGGGEPLLCSDLFELAGYASGLGFKVSMNTNGWLLDETRAALAKNAGFETVGVSIDSHRAEVHDGFRNMPGSFERAVNAVRQLRSNGVRVTMSSVICRINADEFVSLVDMAESLGVEQIFLHNYKCAGMGMTNRDELDLSPPEWREFYIKAMNLKAARSGIRISMDDPITATIKGGDAESPLVKGSTCGKLSLNIRANGDVTPCGFIPVPIGNLLRDDFDSIWRGSDVLGKLRNKEPKAKCLQCKHYADCLGGCSARAYAATGDFESPDPHCWFEPV
ncbi:MAG: GeoRSP system radical SAM/SPASM protein [Nitrospirae bacterium]|nr:GeoRSP system radical SAM/SPASM protein [Nitrospirota bacterium]